MMLPGRKLLREFDLARQRLTLDDLLRSCQQVGLSGFAELKLSTGAGMILYYMGAIASVVYREGPIGYNGSEALDSLTVAMAGAEGSVFVYELPLDLAHVLRGITNRHRASPLRTPADLQALLEQMKRQQHTGMVEVQVEAGSAVILVISGRISHIYWDAGDGVTLEQGPALAGLQLSLKGSEAVVFQSTFSRDAWKSRHEVEPEPPDASGAHGGRPLDMSPVDYETALREGALEELDAQIPSMVQAVLLDLMTGAVLTRRIRGTAALRSALVADKIPPFMLQLCELLSEAGGDELEMLEVATAETLIVVTVVSESREAIALIADKSQPAAQVAPIVDRVTRSYGAHRRGPRPAVPPAQRPA